MCIISLELIVVRDIVLSDVLKQNGISQPQSDLEINVKIKISEMCGSKISHMSDVICQMLELHMISR